MNVARKSTSLARAGIQANGETQKALAAWVEEKKIDNFRRAAAEVELFLLQRNAKSQGKPEEGEAKKQ